MDPFLSEEFIALLLFLTMAVLFGYGIYRLIKMVERKKRAFFQAFADDYASLRYEQDKEGIYGLKKGPLLLGEIEEKPFICFTYSTGSGKQTVHWTKFELKHHLELNNYTLKLVNEHLFRTIGKKLGAIEELELGIEGFDKRFLIQSDDLSMTRAIFSKNVRDQLIEIPKMYFGELLITKDLISYQLPFQIVNDKTYNHFRTALDASVLMHRELKRIYR